MTLDDSSPAAIALLVNGVAHALKAWPAFPNHLIPLACMALGGIANVALEGWSNRNLVVGICAGGMAVGLHQACRQLSSRGCDTSPSSPSSPSR